MTQDLLDSNTDQLDDFNPDANYLEELVGEGKKFKDVGALAKGKAQADSFIKQLEREQATLREDYIRLREDYNAVPKLQELLDQLNSQQLTSNNTTLDVNEDNKPAIKLEDVEALIERRESLKREEENFNIVQNKLVERYGPNYKQHIKEYSEQLGMSGEEVNKMARTNPKAFEKLFLNTPSKDLFETPPASSRRSDSFAPRVQKRDWNYYENLRKTDPSNYWLPKTQNQMHADAKTLGADFGGFN